MGRPIRTFQGFIGQRQTIELVKRHIAGSRATGRTLPNMAITGSPGIGKTSLVRAMAHELGVAVVPIVAAADMQRRDMHQHVTAMQNDGILLIDEAHNLPSDVKELLLGAAGEDRRVPKLDETGRRSHSSSTEMISVAEFTLACATDKPGRLGRPLLSRLPLRLDLRPYSDDEIRAIVLRACNSDEYGLSMSPQAARLLAQAARGTPRDAMHLLDLLATYEPCNGREISTDDVRRFLRAHGTDEILLRALEQRYLKLLAAHPDHPVSGQFISATLGVDPVYLADAAENHLRRCGFVEVLSAGRLLTAEGKQVAARCGVANDTDQAGVTAVLGSTEVPT